MGCDIHGYIEFKENLGYWEWADGRLMLPRDYLWYALLAGVRNDFAGIDPVISPRGIPDDASRRVLYDFFFEIVEQDVRPEYTFDAREPQFKAISPSIASEWRRRWPQNAERSWIGHDLIQDPDNHTPSWLTLREMEAVEQRYLAYSNERGRLWYLDAMQLAVTAVMRTLPTSRFVFWFDN